MSILRVSFKVYKFYLPDGFCHLLVYLTVWNWNNRISGIVFSASSSCNFHNMFFKVIIPFMKGTKGLIGSKPLFKKLGYKNFVFFNYEINFKFKRSLIAISTMNT